MDTPTRPRASLGTGKKKVPAVQARAQTILDSMTANAAMFVSPTITMAAFLALIAALAVAQQQATGTKAKGSATLRNTRRDAVWTAMEMLRAYVQSLCDAMSADAATATIEAAGMLVAATAVHHKDVLTAKLTTTPGVVHLDANASLLAGPAFASKKVIFHWQWSVDAGETWHDVRSTAYANTDVVGLGLMSTYSFRACVNIGKVAGAWSQAVTLLVH
jgi:hypothetical protein